MWIRYHTAHQLSPETTDWERLDKARIELMTFEVSAAGYMRLLTTAYGHCKPTYHSDKLKHTTLCAPSTGGQDNERHSAPLISYPAD